MPDGLAVHLEQVEPGRIERAGLVLSVSGHEFALDADGGGFVLLPALSTGMGMVSISHDGRRMLARDHPANSRELVMITLVDGEEQRLPPKPHEDDVHAAFSPNGTTIAVIGNDETASAETVYVSLVDTSTGRRRRVWQGPGRATHREATVCWSPDGTAIAASHTYRQRGRDRSATAFMDVSGTVLATRDRAHIPHASNTAWISGHEAVLCSDDERNPRYRVIDTRTGEASASVPCQGTLDGVGAGRLIHRTADLDAPSGPAEKYSTTALDGQDRRPLFALTPIAGPHLHAAPQALRLS